MPRLHLHFQNRHNFTQVFDGWPSCRAAGPHQICILPHVWTSHLRRFARAQNNPHSTTCWGTDTRDLRKWLLPAKKIRTSPHHMFAHPARAISAEGCPRTNKTCISPHVWASDTPQRVTFSKPPPGCPCRQGEVEELEKSDFAGGQIQFDHLEVSWTPVWQLQCNSFCANDLAGVL